MNTTKTTTTETLTCECGTPFQWTYDPKDDFEIRYLKRDHCSECSERIRAENERLEEECKRQRFENELAQKKEATESKAWNLIPPRYQQTDSKHPKFNRDLWGKVKAWSPGDESPFLGLIGESGACKTRIGYRRWYETISEMVKPCGEPDHRWIYVPSFTALNSSELALLVGRQFLSHDRDRAEARNDLDLVRKCKVLFLDDLGKAKNTPSVAAELFAIIEHRLAHNLTTIWTANSSPEEIVNGMGEDMAGPLAGRLIDGSTIVRA